MRFDLFMHLFVINLLFSVCQGQNTQPSATIECFCVCVCGRLCVRGHMLSHRRFPVLSLPSGSVRERRREITVPIANFKVSTGVVPGQHVYAGELVLGHTGS